MTIANVSQTPVKWTDAQLEAEAQKALEEFVARRLAEPGGKYLAHVNARRKAIVKLFKRLAGVNPFSPNPATVRAVLLDDELFDALRYVTGPPVSKDDLGVLVTKTAKGINKGDIKTKDDVPVSVLQLICKLADPFRFPWIAASRAPTQRELRTAVAATMTMHAAQSLQTERRAYGKAVEKNLETRLIELGFIKVSGDQPKKPKKPKPGDPPVVVLPPFPAKGQIKQPTHYPTYPHFYGECSVYGRKVDLFIGLPTGRMIALEAKDSSSGLNSTKRLLNDTAAKAKHFAVSAGTTIITVALLSGVFKLSDLKAAQDADLYLVWAHEVDSFIEWIKAQVPS